MSLVSSRIFTGQNGNLKPFSNEKLEKTFELCFFLMFTGKGKTSLDTRCHLGIGSSPQV